MALVNPSTLYSGGQAAFNSNPAMNFYLRQQAKEKATNDALEKYYGNLDKNVTSAGMRGQEIPAFEAAKNNIGQYWMQNKDKILRGDVQAQMQYKNLINTASQIAQVGKENYAIDKAVGSARLTNPNAINWDDNTLGYTHDANGNVVETGGGLVAHSKPAFKIENGIPVPNPEFKKFDPSTTNYNPKMLDAKGWEDKFSSIAKNVKPAQWQSEEVQIDPYTKGVVFKGKFTNEQMKDIGDRIRYDYQSDPSTRFSFDKAHKAGEWVKNNPDEFVKLNQLHKQVYGKDINNNEDLLASMAIDFKNNEQVTQPKTIGDFANRQKLQNQYIVGRKPGGKSGETEKPDVVESLLVKYPNAIEEFSEPISGLKLKRFNVSKLTTDEKNAVLASGAKPYTNQNTGEKYFQVKDGDLYGINDVKVSKTDANSTYYPANKYDVQQKAEGLKPKETKAQPSVQPFEAREADLLKNGWDKNKIKIAVGAGKLKLIK